MIIFNHINAHLQLKLEHCESVKKDTRKFLPENRNTRVKLGCTKKINYLREWVYASYGK